MVKGALHCGHKETQRLSQPVFEKSSAGGRCFLFVQTPYLVALISQYPTPGAGRSASDPLPIMIPLL